MNRVWWLLRLCACFGFFLSALGAVLWFSMEWTTGAIILSASTMTCFFLIDMCDTKQYLLHEQEPATSGFLPSTTMLAGSKHGGERQ